jgi:Zn-dependent M32 family carboxypeptidase
MGFLVDARTGEMLDGAEARPPADPWARANLVEMRRAWRHATALPADLVGALSRAASAAEMRWRTARKANDFAGLLPDLQRVYDALLDEYEPGARGAAIAALFDDLAAFLPGFIDAVIEKQARMPAPLKLPGPFPAAAQRALAERLMREVGFAGCPRRGGCSRSARRAGWCCTRASRCWSRCRRRARPSSSATSRRSPPRRSADRGRRGAPRTSAATTPPCGAG